MSAKNLGIANNARTIGRVLAAAALVTVGALSAPHAGEAARAKDVEFRGGGYFRNFTAACADTGFTDPAYANAIYRPRKLGTNGNSTRFAFFFPPFYATSYELPKGKLRKAFKPVVGGATGTVTEFFAVKPKMRITEMTPPKPRAKTRSLSISGEIENFDGKAGCKVDFELTLQRQR